MTEKQRQFVLPLVALVFVNFLPGLFLRPVWLVLVGIALLALRAWIDWRDWRMPPRSVQWLMQISVGFMVWSEYETFFGAESAGTLLTLLTVLKVYELKKSRDFFVGGLLCFLILMSYLLLDQSLTLTFFMIADAGMILTFLYALEQGTWNWKSWRAAWQPTFLTMLKSVPMMVIVFILFPRFSTGFGAGDDVGAKTGITDQLRPGTVSKLISSDELIFRATFLTGEMLSRRQLYWRSAVLDRGSGLNWDRSPQRSYRRSPPPTRPQSDIEIYLEPGFERFLFALENTHSLIFPNDPNRYRVVFRDQDIFELNRPILTRERYFLELGEPVPMKETDDSLRIFLKVTEAPSQRMRNLIRPWRGRSTTEIIRGVMDYFATSGYEYSLQPPTAISLDQFLFENKSGFCEHYAGATATILRYLGVPARIVVGFQGGTPSLLQNYITVRGHDAHAWVEYYDQAASRWRRLDPTLVVSPERISQGSDTYLASRNGGFFTGDLGKLWRRSQVIFDEVEAAWIGFLIRFDLARQREILALLGMDEVLFRALPVFLLLSLALVLALLYFFEARRTESLPTEEILYRELVKLLERFEVEKMPFEGPLALMRRVESHSPELAEEVRPILEKLIELRFSKAQRSAQDYRELRRSLARLFNFRLAATRH